MIRFFQKSCLYLLLMLGLTTTTYAETVLVGGATGRQGNAVIDELLARGYEVRGMTRKPDGTIMDVVEAYIEGTATVSISDPLIFSTDVVDMRRKVTRNDRMGFKVESTDKIRDKLSVRRLAD